MSGLLKKWWFWVGLILVIGIAVNKNGGNKEQEAAEALVNQIKQFESELGKVKIPEISIIKRYDKRYRAFIDSSNVYAKKESIRPESVSEIKIKLNHIKTTLDSLVTANLINRMLGSYKGQGQTATEIPNWGIVPSGAAMTDIIIDKNQNMFYSRMSPDFSQNQASFKIIEIAEINDSTLVGYFQNKANGVKFCTFEWSPSKLNLKGNLWKTENKKQ
jgi:hypothetical protein